MTLVTSNLSSDQLLCMSKEHQAENLNCTGGFSSLSLHLMQHSLAGPAVHACFCRRCHPSRPRQIIHLCGSHDQTHLSFSLTQSQVSSKTSDFVMYLHSVSLSRHVLGLIIRSPHDSPYIPISILLLPLNL